MLEVILGVISFIDKVIYDKLSEEKKKKLIQMKIQPLLGKYNDLYSMLKESNENPTYSNISKLISKTIEIVEILKEIKDEDIKNEITKDVLGDFKLKKLQECKIDDRIRYKVLDISPLLSSENIKSEIIQRQYLSEQSKELAKLLREFSSKYQNIRITKTINDNDISRGILEIIKIIEINKHKYEYLSKGLIFITSIQEAGSIQNNKNFKIKYTHESYERLKELYKTMLEELIQNVQRQIEYPTRYTRGGNIEILKKVSDTILPKMSQFIINILENNHTNICADHYESKYNTENN